MKVLIVGGGGREHALAWKVAQSKQVAQVYVAPGNAGSAAEPGVQNVDIGALDIPALANFARAKEIDLTIAGAEAPLAAGIVDAFAAQGLQCFGPTQNCARLESSKIFAKEFLARHAIPSAASKSFSDEKSARAHLAECAYPIVVKADGLASGKGVVIAQSRAEAESALDAMMTQKSFGDAGRRVLIEEFLEGEEASFICIADGEHALPLAGSQDHKAAQDGGRGANTGGMGAYSPAAVIDAGMHARIMREIIVPTLRGLRAEGMHYTGFLYAGLMIDAKGAPRVLEFNCRLGDPEAQVILLRMRSDLTAHCLAALRHALPCEKARWDARAALGVVLAAHGYPHAPQTGMRISGNAYVNECEPPRKMFHAGTALRDGELCVSGGRVLCAAACGDDVRAAAKAAYRLADEVHWRGCRRRNDIGHRAIARENAARA